MRRKRIPAVYCLAAGLVIILAGGGCASAPTFRGFFQEHRPDLSVTDQGLLLETLRVISLLEGYCLALESKDMNLLLSGYSPRYFHYEHGLEWRKQRIEKSYFSPFDRLEAEFGPVGIEFVRRGSGYWLKQEDFDWLRSPRGEASPLRSYRIILPTEGGPVELLLGKAFSPSSGPDRDYSLPRGPVRKPGGEGVKGPLPVTVSSLVDPSVERPLSEVSSRISIRGYLAGGESFISTIRERTIFLLEKEEGEWRIISQF